MTIGQEFRFKSFLERLYELYGQRRKSTKHIFPNFTKYISVSLGCQRAGESTGLQRDLSVFSDLEWVESGLGEVRRILVMRFRHRSGT